MPLFGPPNVERLAAKSDVKGLIRALRYRGSSDVRSSAAEALGGIGDTRAVVPLEMALHDRDKVVVLVAVDSLERLGHWTDRATHEGHRLGALVGMFLDTLGADQARESGDGAVRAARLATESARQLGAQESHSAVPFLVGALLRLHEELGEPSAQLLGEGIRSAVLVALQRCTGERYGPEPDAWMAWMDANLPLDAWEGILG